MPCIYSIQYSVSKFIFATAKRKRNNNLQGQELPGITAIISNCYRTQTVCPGNAENVYSELAVPFENILDTEVFRCLVVFFTFYFKPLSQLPPFSKLFQGLWDCSCQNLHIDFLVLKDVQSTVRKSILDYYTSELTLANSLLGHLQI